MNSLNGKIAIVTGACGGIGSAIVNLLSDNGATVILVDIDKEKLDNLVANIRSKNRNVLGFKVDVRDEIGVEEMFKAIDKQYGHLDVLINNAGLNRKALIVDQTLENWKLIIDTNLTGYFLLGKAALQRMIAQRSGDIINILSVHAIMSEEYQGAYSASKWGAMGLTRAMIREARPYGVRVTALCPGGVQTDFHQSPRPHYMSPEVIAQAVLNILSFPSNCVVHEMIIRNMCDTNFY